jgi:hypothetical protein
MQTGVLLLFLLLPHSKLQVLWLTKVVPGSEACKSFYFDHVLLQV